MAHCAHQKDSLAPGLLLDQQVAEEARRGASVINAVPSRDFRRAEFLLGLHLKKIKVTRRWTGMTCLLLIPLML